MNELCLPRQEEVQEFNVGDGRVVKVIELTDENRPAILKAALMMYLDDECMYCHRNFTEEELETAIWAHPNEFGRIVHKECWDANN